MWVLVVLAVVWVIALTPMVLRKFSERKVVTSVTSFHCHLLRLGSAYGRPRHGRASTPGTALGFSAAALRLWEERYTPSAAAAAAFSDNDDSDGTGTPFRSARRPFGDSSDGAACAAPDSTIAVGSLSGADSGRSEIGTVTSPLTAARRRRVVMYLAAMTGLFFLLGFIPPARMLWDVALISVAVSLAYLAALIHFHRRAVERAQKVVALETRRHVASALDEARHSRTEQPVMSGRATAGRTWSVRATSPSGSASSGGQESVAYSTPPDRKFAASGR